MTEKYFKMIQLILGSKLFLFSTFKTWFFLFCKEVSNHLVIAQVASSLRWMDTCAYRFYTTFNSHAIYSNNTIFNEGIAFFVTLIAYSNKHGIGFRLRFLLLVPTSNKRYHKYYLMWRQTCEEWKQHPPHIMFHLTQSVQTYRADCIDLSYNLSNLLLMMPERWQFGKCSALQYTCKVPDSFLHSVTSTTHIL